MISEEKMQIVINNYFKSECSVDTSIRQAFEKGFRIGVEKGLTVRPERKKGEWIKAKGMMPPEFHGYHYCSECGDFASMDVPYGSRENLSNYCPNCGADMRGE